MIRKAGLVVAFAVVSGLAFAPSASAQLVCPDLSLVTAPGTTLSVPNPVCTGTSGFPISFTVVAGSAMGGTAVDGPPMAFTPAMGFHGPGSFRYTGFDGGIMPSDPAAVNVLVDTKPVCPAGARTVAAGASVALTSLGCTDADGDPLEFEFGMPANGTVAMGVYTPRAGFSGTDSFPFRARETNYGLASDDATMTVTVTAPAAATPTPTPGGTNADRTAPKVTLKAKKATYAKGIPLTLTVDEGAKAVLTISLDAKNAKKYKLSRSIGKGNSTLTAAGSKAITLKLSAKARKAFKKLRQMKVTVTAVVTDAAGNATTKTLKVTVKKQ